jgi:DNA polymerase elongation subunit (family B)
LNKIVFDRTHRQKKGVEGALVLSVKRGLHGYTASCDIQSLYPSVYRTLNLSPEMIVGQLLGYEADWKKVYLARSNPDNDVYKMAIVKMVIEGQDDSEAIEMTVGDLLTLMDEKKIACSAYGTLLNQADGEGLIPAVLSYWFTGRKELQALKKKHAKNADSYQKGSPEYVEEMRLSAYYDMLQGVRKVLLNSSYGATLNEWCRFHDPRLGASTTGSGRQITTYMLETVTEQLVGHHIPLVKTIEVDEDSGEVENLYTIDCPKGLGPIMSDTDSCYFLLDALIENDDVDTAVELADAIVRDVNNGFPKFTELAFNCQPNFLGKINANREIVAKSGIIRANKK